jgi:hypothetical protein
VDGPNSGQDVVKRALQPTCENGGPGGVDVLVRAEDVLEVLVHGIGGEGKAKTGEDAFQGCCARVERSLRC